MQRSRHPTRSPSQTSDEAAISRWFRQSEAGWLFYDHRGRAWHLLTEEAERLEAQALRWRARWLRRHLSKDERADRFKILVILVTCLALGGISDLAGLGGMAILAACMMVVVAQGLAQRAEYHLQHFLWRKRIARGLRRKGRGGVPWAIAAKHHRHNLFQSITRVCVGVWASVGVIGWLFDPDLGIGTIVGLGVVLPVATAVLAVAGERVDATHLRRKWLD